MSTHIAALSRQERRSKGYWRRQSRSRETSPHCDARDGTRQALLRSFLAANPSGGSLLLPAVPALDRELISQEKLDAGDCPHPKRGRYLEITSGRTPLRYPRETTAMLLVAARQYLAGHRK